MAAATAAKWTLQGKGYEFCNCDFGCGCNFGGFPNSKDGSCRALGRGVLRRSPVPERVTARFAALATLPDEAAGELDVAGRVRSR
jgi:hypothetical protein